MSMIQLVSEVIEMTQSSLLISAKFNNHQVDNLCLGSEKKVRYSETHLVYSYRYSNWWISQQFEVCS